MRWIVFWLALFKFFRPRAGSRIVEFWKNQLIVIVNENKKSFPVRAYGGVCMAVQTLAMSAHKAGLDIVVISPRPHDLSSAESELFPFPILIPATSTSEPMYIEAVLDTLIELKQIRDIGVVWANGVDISSHIANRTGLPTVGSYSDSGTPQSSNVGRFPNLIHRFLTHVQRALWTRWGNDDIRRASFVQNYGFADYEFQDPSESGAVRGSDVTFLSADYNQYIKGILAFCGLAKRNPDLSFVAYGLTGTICEDPPPNLSVRGPVSRGPQHVAMMQSSRVFVLMPLWDEAFGRVVVEAASKGVPVLANCQGGLPELIRQYVPALPDPTATRCSSEVEGGGGGGEFCSANGFQALGLTARSDEALDQALRILISPTIDTHAIYKAAKERFPIETELRGMLEASAVVLAGAMDEAARIARLEELSGKEEDSLVWGQNCYFGNKFEFVG